MKSSEFLEYAISNWRLHVEAGGRPEEHNLQTLIAESLPAIIALVRSQEGATDASRLIECVDSPGGIQLFCGSILWTACGLPRIEMSHKFAAALCCSDIHEDVADLAKRPWPAFTIEVPEGLIHMNGRGGRAFPIRRILVMQDTWAGDSRDWSYLGLTDGPMTLRTLCTARELLPPRIDDDGTKTLPGMQEPTEEGRRVQVVIGRLIINSCLAMTMPDLSSEVGMGHAAWKKAKADPAKMTGPRIFRIGKPVVVDLRDRVTEYLRGARTARQLDTRTLVRGHFKRQHHGPGNRETKVIFREPYYVGPEDGDVLIRPHVATYGGL